MKIGIIYKATNVVTGKAYIGQTSQTLKKRWINHQFSKKSGFDASIKKHGPDRFTLEVVEIVQAFTDRELRECLNASEKRHIALHGTKVPNGYNLTEGGDGLLRPSPETKKKISIAVSAVRRQMGPRSEEARKNIGIGLQGNQNSIGKTWTEESLKKLSDAMKAVHATKKQARNSLGWFE